VVKNSLQKLKKHKKCKISNSSIIKNTTNSSITASKNTKNSSITASHPPRNDDFACKQMTEWGG
jgi:hypothetical protein